MRDLLLQPLADAFLQVGVYVAVAVTGFDLLRVRFGDRVTGRLAGRPAWGPLVGALLGVTPGCGGAILVMPLYAQGRISFGTVVAALVATMGDSSWVVIAGDPALALRLHLLLFVAGLLSGYVVDTLFARHPAGRARRPVPTAAAEPRPARRSPSALGKLTPVFWAICVPASALSVAALVRESAVPAGGVAPAGRDLALVVGTAGCLVAVAMFVAGRGRRPAGCSPQGDTVSAVLRNGAGEASFVTAWVAVAFLAWQLLSELSGFDGSQLVLAGVAGVLVGAAVGLVPGCAVHIVFTGLYLSGGMPLSTLAANAVSQDGDALIPLAALRLRVAVAASAVTTVPAVFVGLLVLTVT